MLDTLVILSAVLLKEPGGLRIGWGVWVGVAQEALNRSKNGRNIIDWAPVALQNVKTDAAIIVDVRMEQLGDELDDGRFVRVVLGEEEREFEGSTFPWGIIRAMSK